MNNERGSETGKSAIDPVFKQVITTLFQGWEINIQTEFEVSKLPLRIDAIIRVPTLALHAIRYLTPFWYFLIHNVIEFKGRADALTIYGYQRILSRSYQYLAEHQLDNPELTLTIVSARKPRTVLSRSYLGFKQIAEGYYFCDNGGLQVYLIVTNELPVDPVNYSLLLFASSKKKIQKIIEDIMRNEWVEYIQYAVLLHPDITQEVAMANRLRLPRRNMELIAEYLGRDLVPFINLEDRVHDLTPAQRLQGLDAAQRLQGLALEDIRDSLSDEERQALRQLLDDQESDTQD
jgi:hypothetical protein